MSVNVNEWKIRSDTIVLGQVLSFQTSKESVKIVSKALDGTTYIQTIGSGVRKATVSALCTLDEKDNFIDRDAIGAPIQVTYRDKYYVGYVEETPEFSPAYPNAYFTTQFTLLIEEEGRSS